MLGLGFVFRVLWYFHPEIKFQAAEFVLVRVKGWQKDACAIIVFEPEQKPLDNFPVHL